MNYTKAQAQRDLHPHAPARAAMWRYSADYARSGLGSMGYWDRLPERDKELCRRMAADIKACPDEPKNGG